MKTQTRVLLAMLMLTTLPAYAQVRKKQTESTEPPKQNIFKVNLLSPIYGTLMVFYQRNLDEEKSFQVGLGYMNFYGFNSFAPEHRNQSTANHRDVQFNFSEETKAIFITPEYRIALWGENMKGFYAAPFVKYTYMSYQENWDMDTAIVAPYYYYSYSQDPSGKPMVPMQSRYEYNSVGVGVTVGQQLIFKNKISLEYYAGPVYNILLNSSGTKLPNSSTLMTSDYLNTFLLRGYGMRAGLTLGFLF